MYLCKCADEFLTGLTPFEAESENPMDTYHKIMTGKYIAYAETAQAQDLIAGLLCVLTQLLLINVRRAHAVSCTEPSNAVASSFCCRRFDLRCVY